MIRSVILFVLLGCFGLTALAADPAFVVFYSSGNAAKTVSGKPVLLKKGDHLLGTDQVTLPEKAQLVLVCANFSVIQLKTKGNYAIKALLAKCNLQRTSASSAYFKYIWSQFAHAHKSPDADPRSYMKTYGAASRGKGVVTKLNTDTIFYYDGALQIGWAQNKWYAVQVYSTDASKKLMLSGKLSKAVNIDSIAMILKKPGSYYWDFAGFESDKFRVLQILDKKEYEQLKTSILTNVVITTAAETAYLSGYMLEEKHFLAEAAKYYEKALKLMPDNQVYQSAALRFKP